MPEAELLPLDVKGLVFEVRDTRLIDHLDLHLGAGPRTVILGPNGAGKSTLLRLLHGLVLPSAGSIRWAGRRLGHEVQCRQGLLLQRPVLLRRSAVANLRYALRAGGVPRNEIRERAELWLRRANLEAVARRPARVLSGGEQQRLALARVLSLEPEVLLLDEPAASLDPGSALAVERLVCQAHRAGTKIVLVTHDLAQARRLADEVVFLYRGRLEEQSPAAAFFSGPRSERARAFVEGRLDL